MEEDWLTTGQVARQLGITRQAVLKRLRLGLMEGQMAAGEFWLVSPAEVERQRGLVRRPPAHRAAPEATE